jgi:hypothetical protein
VPGTLPPATQENGVRAGFQNQRSLPRELLPVRELEARVVRRANGVLDQQAAPGATQALERFVLLYPTVDLSPILSTPLVPASAETASA